MVQSPKLEEMFRSVLKNNNVYFQPPESVKMKYPCIIYGLSGSVKVNADDTTYHHRNRYTVTLITRDPNAEQYNEITNWPMCRFDRHYTASGLHHFVFTIY